MTRAGTLSGSPHPQTDLAEVGAIPCHRSAASGASLSLISAHVVGHFDQIHVGVTEIHQHHQPSCAISFDWASD